MTHLSRMTGMDCIFFLENDCAAVCSATPVVGVGTGNTTLLAGFAEML